MEQSRVMPEMRPAEDRETTPANGWSGRSIGSTTSPKVLEPMTRQMAAKLVRRLLAGYPNLNAHDPEGYIAALVQTVSDYPQWAGERIILRVDEERPEFPPAERVVRTWLEDAVRPHRFAAEWNARTLKQIAERPREEPEPKKDLGAIGDGSPGAIYSNYDEAVKNHGRPHGVFEAARQVPYNPGSPRATRNYAKD